MKNRLASNLPVVVKNQEGYLRCVSTPKSEASQSHTQHHSLEHQY